jgi:MerR family copper efflux transcriptional regulator
LELSVPKSSEPIVHLPILAPREDEVRSLLAAKLPAPPDKLLQVGELARASGKTVRAIHHYEELGLLKPDARSKGRFRLYDPTAVARVRWIGKLHDLGMSLAEILKVVETWGTAPSASRAMAELRIIYRGKLQETRAQIAHLTALEKELEASIAYLDTCDSCGEPVTVTPSEDEGEPEAPCGGCQLRERDAEPDLVAGIVA